jgi:hypothetical protein
MTDVGWDFAWDGNPFSFMLCGRGANVLFPEKLPEKGSLAGEVFLFSENSFCQAKNVMA